MEYYKLAAQVSALLAGPEPLEGPLADVLAMICDQLGCRVASVLLWNEAAGRCAWPRRSVSRQTCLA
ncbi:MAG: hypothetical protein FJZ01_24220 [Candidatus Sericytochromatia bacterium]|nr:hypothetical protein [Candidatus Tanganyikabacteria bacterium]